MGRSKSKLNSSLTSIFKFGSAQKKDRLHSSIEDVGGPGASSSLSPINSSHRRAKSSVQNFLQPS